MQHKCSLNRSFNRKTKSKHHSFSKPTHFGGVIQTASMYILHEGNMCTHSNMNHNSSWQQNGLYLQHVQFVDVLNPKCSPFLQLACQLGRSSDVICFLSFNSAETNKTAASEHLQQRYRYISTLWKKAFI